MKALASIAEMPRPLPVAGPATVPVALGLPEEVLARALRAALDSSGIVGVIAEATEAQLGARGIFGKERAAAFLEIEVHTLEVWMRPVGDRGGRGLPHFKIGTQVRFCLAALEAWLAKHEQNRVLPETL